MYEGLVLEDTPAGAPVCATGNTMLTGPLLIGFLMAYLFFGVLCTQVYTYWIAFPKDKTGLKFYVWTMFLLEVAVLGMNTNTAWWFFGSGYGQLSHFIRFDPTTPLQPLMAGILTAMFHAFYAWRIYGLSNWRTLPVIIILITLIQLGMTIYIAIRGVQLHGDLAAITEPKFRIVYAVWQAAGIGADVVVSAGMTYILWRAKRLTISERTVSRINDLIKFTAETGALITILELVNVCLYLFKNHTFLYFMVWYIITKLYSNTLLSTLNSRVTFVTEGSSGTQSSQRDVGAQDVVLYSNGTLRSPTVRLSTWGEEVNHDETELSVITPAYCKDATGSPRSSRLSAKIREAEDI